MNWILTMITRVFQPKHQPDMSGRAVEDAVALTISLAQLRMLERAVEHAEYCPTSCDFVRFRAELRVLLELVRRRREDIEQQLGIEMLYDGVEDVGL